MSFCQDAEVTHSGVAVARLQLYEQISLFQHGNTNAAEKNAAFLSIFDHTQDGLKALEDENAELQDGLTGFEILQISGNMCHVNAFGRDQIRWFKSYDPVHDRHWLEHQKLCNRSEALFWPNLTATIAGRPHQTSLRSLRNFGSIL